MFDIVCVTNRHLCKEDFLERVETITRTKPKAIILREKDLPETEYKALAQKVLAICREQGVLCVLHSCIDTAIQLQTDAIHLPLPILRTMSAEKKAYFSRIGASCHSAEEAKEAERLGCTYVTVGHIFATDCKKGLPGRGLDFLEKVCQSVTVPVYAIGGIDKHNIAAVQNAGTAGVCVMSGLMQCADAGQYMEDLKKHAV